MTTPSLLSGLKEARRLVHEDAFEDAFTVPHSRGMQLSWFGIHGLLSQVFKEDRAVRSAYTLLKNIVGNNHHFCTRAEVIAAFDRAEVIAAFDRAISGLEAKERNNHDVTS